MNVPAAISTRVIKLGGSLLDEPSLRRQFSTWLAQQTPARNLVVVGGGALVDAIRDIDRRQQLGEKAAHWLAIDAMSVTAHIAVALVELPLVERMATWEASAAATAIVDVRHFLAEQEPRQPGERLPYGWSVTSDSIAARLATTLGACELVLLKSTLPEATESLAAIAKSGFVDEHFAVAAADLPRVRLVNLKQPGFPERSFVHA
ncbi:MAG: hypothetical protein KF708_16930 [Pirellulales bacterium]|nr:hypothetical protein [Pirellulales bacterium]